MYYIYILGCTDGSLYTGVTTNIIRRVREHYYKLPGCAKYTASRGVCSLEALWTSPEKSSAYRLEYHIKQLTHSQKLSLISSPEVLPQLMPGLDCTAYEICTDIKFADCIAPNE